MAPFSFIQNRLLALWTLALRRLLRHLTKNSPPLFLPINNELTLEPLVIGQYEADLSALIRHFAHCGYTDALFDIGANIGLTTFFNYTHFTVTHCYEPNPLAFLILKANLFDAPPNKVMLHPFGLGADNERHTLHVPKGNIGGAFVNDSSNALTEDELARKDGYETFSEARYSTVPVEIRKGRDIFSDLLGADRGKYLFKIDVEGYEEVVLRELAAALPRTAAAAIIFENWSEQSFDIERVFGHFGRSGQRAKLANTTSGTKSLFMKLVKTLVLGRTHYLDETPERWVGHIVFVLPACEQR